MHGQEQEGGDETTERKFRHMRKIPTRVGRLAVVDGFSSSSSSGSSSPSFFFKDGRKICVGDSALFKPPQDSPPFIGIIRWLTSSKDSSLKLGVNWLYRPTEIKLGKGILLEAAPNEIFYSFHKDEIPAASLLHPCKVAFLPKGIELPPGISSFICRRVYDITQRCLWWLTDQDYINEHQEEVDQLLYKTRVEMHATVQPNGRSPKRMNGPTSSQLKPGSDCAQNSPSSIPSQIKGKKRERGDHQNLELNKRERLSKMEDGDHVHSRSESFLKSEIAKITEKGGLVDLEGVEKLVQLMLPEKGEKRVDLAGRLLLTGVIAGTDNSDCLNRFVQLKGLSVLDEWLQDVHHKGKIGDGGGLKDQDKSVEEFLLVLLRALDKLPVYLQALQMCNIGKSVNQLRTHKSSDIQKKARSLVDTWKKRVEAEMIINDAKSGSNQAVSWSARSRIPEVSHGGNRQTGGSSDAAPKSSVTQLSASKTSSAKLVHGEAVSRSASGSPALVKSAPSHPVVSSNAKDAQVQGAIITGVSELPIAVPKDEKSSSSSQSHNNSHSCSSDHAKTFPGKEDARSSTAGSNKSSGGPLRQRKSINGVPGSAASGRETGSSRTSLNRNVTSEKVFQSGTMSEKAVDVPVEANSHKLIVKISNKARSPAQSIGGGSEEPSIMNSRASSPVQLERPDQDSGTKEKNDVCQANISSEVNAESWESNDFKDMLNACDEDVGSPGPLSGGDNGKTGENSKKEVSKACVSSAKELKSGKLPESSYGSMNALVESCANESEANAPALVGDDVGMNLLASVAAGEMFRSQVASPADSPQRRSSPVEKPCTGNDSKMKSSPHHDLASDSSQLNDPAGEGLPAEGHKQQAADPCQECDRCENELSAVAAKSPSPGKTSEKTEAEENNQVTVEKTLDAIPDNKIKGESLLAAENIVNEAASHMEVKGEATEVGSTSDKDDKNQGSHETNDSGLMEHNSSGSLLPKLVDEEPISRNPDQIKVEKIELKVEKAMDKDAKIHDYKTLWKSNASRALDVPSIAGSGPDVTDHKVENMEENVESKADSVLNFSGPHHKIQTGPVHERDSSMTSKVCRSNGSQSDKIEECTSTVPDAGSVAASGRSDIDGKVQFDLNEGFSVDDGKCGEPVNSTISACSTSVPLVSPLPFPVSLPLASLTAPIAVAAATKGLFVPPDDLLKTKVELGWKGSAATSAFRPAEPRKVVEMSLGTTNPTRSPDATPGRQSRPPLDIDLNVPDERIIEDIASRNSGVEAASLPSVKSTLDKTCDEMSVSARGFGGLDLDLNRVDETLETWNYSTSSSRKLDVSVLPAKASSGHPNGVDAGVRRDFDLNDGPVDDVTAEPSTTTQSTRSSMPTQQPVSGLRLTNAEVGNFSNWFPPGNTFSGVTIPSILSDRGEQPFPIVATGNPPRVLGPTSGIPFSPDLYRGPVLSSPAVPFSSTPFQYPVFPYGSSFPLPSASFSGSSTTYVDPSSGGRLVFPPVHPQMLGPSGPVSSQFQRPFVVNLPDGSSSIDSSRKWSRPGLDLNTGPVGIEGRDETTAHAPRLSMTSSQALAEEQARMYQSAGGILKRKEPDGGWDSYKQSSWQ